MEATFPMFFVIAIAAGAGLLAVFALWVSKRIADEKTRTHGITIVAITVAVLVLGMLVTRTSVRPNPPPAVVMPNSSASVSMDSSGSNGFGAHMQVHAQNQPPVVAHVAARFAWGPLTLAAVVVAVIVLAVTSRKGLAAALAGFGIVAAILVLYLSAARHVPQSAQIAPIMPTPATMPPYVVHESVPLPTAAPVAENAAHEHSSTDHGAEAEATKVEKAVAEDDKHSHDHAATEVAKTPAPAWIKSEPTMEGGVYRAVVVSGPYSSKRECESNLDQPLRRALMEYARDHLSPNAQYHAWADIDYVRSNMVSKPDDAHWYLAEAEYGVGTMYNLYVQLTVDPQDAARFNQLARQSEIRRAVESTSLGGASVLAMLAVLYGGLRFVGRKKPPTPVNGSPEVPAEATV